jgi:hypothetical protein
MRLSITGSFSLEGLWSEPSDEPLKTSIGYQLLTYGQIIKYRNRLLSPEDLISNVHSIYNCIYKNKQITELKDRNDILDFLLLMDSSLYNELIEEMLRDSILSTEEYRKLEFIVYYLNWKADEHSRRTSYDCNACRKYKFIDSRYCYLEHSTFKLPELNVVINDDTGERTLDNNENEVDTDETQLIEVLNELTLVNKDLSIFEIFQKYFFSMMEGSKRVELCPEAIKIHSENLAEMFEMEARCHEYHIFPFEGGQLDQTALLVEAFDAIRSGRNTFHSKKMDEVSRSGKGK